MNPGRVVAVGGSLGPRRRRKQFTEPLDARVVVAIRRRDGQRAHRRFLGACPQHGRRIRRTARRPFLIAGHRPEPPLAARRRHRLARRVISPRAVGRTGSGCAVGGGQGPIRSQPGWSRMSCDGPDVYLRRTWRVPRRPGVGDGGRSNVSVTCTVAAIRAGGRWAQCAAEPARPRQRTQQETTSERPGRSARWGWRGSAVTRQGVAASIARPAAAYPRIKSPLLCQLSRVR